jgi:hypothetical protein
VPSNPDEVAEEARRVMEEPPSRWWWKPRYLLAELVRGGHDHDEALKAVRAKFGGVGE